MSPVSKAKRAAARRQTHMPALQTRPCGAALIRRVCVNTGAPVPTSTAHKPVDHPRNQPNSQCMRAHAHRAPTGALHTDAFEGQAERGEDAAHEGAPKESVRVNCTLLILVEEDCVLQLGQ